MSATAERGRAGPDPCGRGSAPGTWRLGGAYGHSWSVDGVNGLTTVAFTQSGLVGQSPGGRFPADLAQAVYAGGEIGVGRRIRQAKRRPRKALGGPARR